MKNNVLQFTLAIFCLFLSFKNFGQVPVASFALAQTSVCAGSTVQVTDLSSNTPTAWSYTVQGIAASFTLQNPVLTLSTAGVFSVHLVASNGSGNSAIHTETIMVYALPLVSAGASTAICEGTYISFNASGANSYNWSGGVIDGTSFAPLSTTVFTVTGTNLNGCESSAIRTITVNPLPVLAVNGPTAVCAGTGITLTVSGANTYTWDTGGIHTTTLSDTPLISTTYSVAGRNALTGCLNSTGYLVNVNDLPVVYVNSGSICSGKSFTLIPGGANSYTFSSGTPVVSPTTSMVYTVTGMDANGCVAQVTTEIIVFTLPVVSVNSGTFCAGTVFHLLPSGASVYSISPGTSFNVSPSTTTSYSIIGTDVNGCVSSNPAIATVSVLASPIISVNSGSICVNEVFTMTPVGAQTYTFSNGSSTVSPLLTTSYTVIGEDLAGCISLPVVSSLTVAPLPLISVNSGSICAGQIFTMTPGGAATYTFVNGTTTVNPIANTSYSITGTTSLGCVSPTYAVSEITVHAVPVLSVNSGSICAGETFTLLPSGADTYVYQGGSNTVSPSSSSIYTISGTSTEGCTSLTTATSVVTVVSLPVLSIAANSAVCIGETATLTASGASTYTWNNNSNLSSITVAPQTTSGYTVSGTTSSGCEASITYSIYVNPLPVINVNSGSVCPGSSFTIIPAGASSYTYSGGLAIVNPSVTTSYSVTGTDSNGCVSPVAAITTVSVANAVTVAVSGNTVICAGETASLSANGASSYSWSTQAFTHTLHVNPTSSTSYTVTGLISSCSNSIVVSVSVNPAPTVSVSSSSSLICAGENATLTSSGANTFVWGNGETGTQIVIQPSLNSTYTVNGMDETNCSATAVFMQNVNECIGLQERIGFDTETRLYPNPNDGNFTISCKEESLIRIFDLTGHMIYMNTLSAETTVDLSKQPDGFYFVFITKGTSSKTIKFLKN